MASGNKNYLRFQPVIDRIRGLFARLPAPLVRLLHVPTQWFGGSLGALGRYLRHARYCAALGDACYFATACVIKYPENLRIGDRFSLHEFSYIDAAGGICIGNDVAIGHNCSILSANHCWADPSQPIKYNPVELAPVEIANDVWVGCGVRILAGTTIETRVVVAAGAVVRGRLESGYIQGGVPARKLAPL